MATKFNSEQLQAIESKKREILVASGAGSGKSTVLVERLMRKIILDKNNVEQFLVVTFTNLAAREMSEKLRLRLSDALNLNPNSTHLQEQLYKLPYANISTFHGFCNKVLKRYHYLVDLDSNVQLMDDMEAIMLRADVLNDFMDSMYEDKDFRLLVDVFGADRSDEPLAELLIKVYEIAIANPDMKDWLSEPYKLYQVKGNTVDGWAFYWQMLELIFPLLDAATDHVLEARNCALAAEMTDVEHGYVQMAQCDLAVIDTVRTGLKSGTYDDVRQLLMHTKLASFPTLSKKMREVWDKETHNQAKESRKKFKEILDTISKDFFAYSNESHVLHFTRGAEMTHALGRIVMLFHEYFQAEKMAQNKLDFSDLERFTLKILTKHSVALQEIASDFKEIMIDEYQDTNAMQERIVKLISDAFNVPMFMVGDVKQSIYRFRLAEPSIFQRKYELYKTNNNNGKKIDLMKNYRSSRGVIDGVNYIFERIMDVTVGEIPYDEEALLKFGAEDAADSFNVPELHLINKAAIGESDEDMQDLHDAELEANHVAFHIQEMVDGNTQLYESGVGYRPVKYDDIVILMRSMKAATTFYDILTQHDIPVFTEQPGDLLTETEVMTIFALLRIIDNPYQDIPLVATMRSPLFFFRETELAKIRASDKTLSFYEVLNSFVKTSPTTELQVKVKNFLAKLKDWRYVSRFFSVANMLRKIYEETTYYDFVLGLPNGSLRRGNLDLLEVIAHGYETRTTNGLYGFLNYIDHIQHQGIRIPKARPESQASECVKIMTIHKSKGLEFPIVFVVNMNKKFNTKDEIGNYILHKKYGIGVQYINPDLRLKQKTIVTTMLAKTLRNEMLAEEMRLLYVAATRAKTKLILTGVLKDHDTITKLAATDNEPAHVRLAATRYLDWVLPVIADRNPDNIWQWQIISEISANTRKNHDILVAEKPPPCINIADVFNQVYELEELREIVAKQSVSQRKIEETIPLYKGIPEPTQIVVYDRPSFITSDAKATEIGTAFHQFMQHFPIQADHTLASIANFKDNLISRGIIKAQLARRINLKDIYNFTTSEVFHQLLKAKKIQKELPFTMLIQAGTNKQAKAMLQGIIDLLAEFDDEVWIVDYKTDQVVNFTLEAAMLRRRYAIQMKYYIQAMRDVYSDKTIIAKVYFIRANEHLVYNWYEYNS